MKPALRWGGRLLSVGVAVVVSNGIEWVAHKYVLHDLGKDKRSFWSFHWHEHHRASRHHGFIDPDYQRGVVGWHAQGREALGLLGVGIAMAPFAPYAPWFVGTMVACGLRYYHLHKKSHLDPEWARTHLPWHYDHHMGPNQNANWCVTNPWFDDWLGTRVPYVGTESEARDVARRQRRAETKKRSRVPVDQPHLA